MHSEVTKYNVSQVEYGMLDLCSPVLEFHRLGFGKSGYRAHGR